MVGANLGYQQTELEEEANNCFLPQTLAMLANLLKNVITVTDYP